MCRALRVLCAASSTKRLGELKQAAVSASWELVGGAASPEELVSEIHDWAPDVVVIDESLGAEAIVAAREARSTVRIVSVGAAGSALAGVGSPVPGADEACSLEELRPAILGLPRPGGPIRG